MNHWRIKRAIKRKDDWLYGIDVDHCLRMNREADWEFVKFGLWGMAIVIVFLFACIFVFGYLLA